MTTPFFEYVDRAFLLNLPERKDRLDASRSALEGIGWRIDGETVELVAASAFKDAGHFPRAGYRGNVETSIRMLEKAQAAGYARILRLEDDIGFRREFRSLEPQLVQTLKETPWDLCYLGCETELKHEFCSRGSIKDGFASDYFTYYSGPLIGSHCVLIDGNLLAPLAAHLRRVASNTADTPEFAAMPYDGAVNHFRERQGCKTLVCKKNLAFQRSSPSSITPKKWQKLLGPRLTRYLYQIRRSFHNEP